MRNFLILLTIGVLLAGCSGKGKRAEKRQAERERYESVMDRRTSSRHERNTSSTSPASSLGELQGSSFNHNGIERHYQLYVPRSINGNKPAPLLLMFHGGGGTGNGMVKTSRMNEVADANGFIIVYADGTGRGKKQTWNAGSTPAQGYAEENNVDDIGYVRELLSQVLHKYSIDKKRIFAAGFSKGSMFTYYLACQLSDQIAAIATVSGPLTYNACKPAQPVALMHTHGDADKRVLLNGGMGDSHYFPSALDGIERWRQFNGCSSATTSSMVPSDTRHTVYQRCKKPVEYFIVNGNGHAWPGSTPKKWHRKHGVHVSDQFNVSQYIWDFMSNNPKP